jgi:hypothetical protein
MRALAGLESPTGNLIVKMVPRIRLFLTVAILSPAGLAQLDRSALMRTVTDPAGARIPAASVKAFSLKRAPRARQKTSAQGTYALDGFPVGRYVILFGKLGFSAVALNKPIKSSDSRGRSTPNFRSMPPPTALPYWSP